MRNGPPMSRTIVGAKAPWGPFASEAEATRASWETVRSEGTRWAMSSGGVWNDAASVIALAIGYAESRFGVTPDWQYPDGTPSWNWGAMIVYPYTTTDPTKFITHGDHTADNKPTTLKFASYPDAAAGIRRWVTQLPKASKAAAIKGDAYGVAKGMYDAHWFSSVCPPFCTDEARIGSYASVIKGASARVTSTLGIPNPVVGAPSSSGAIGNVTATPGDSSGGGLGEIPVTDSGKGAPARGGSATPIMGAILTLAGLAILVRK